jgi:hypothetical protein
VPSARGAISPRATIDGTTTIQLMIMPTSMLLPARMPISPPAPTIAKSSERVSPSEGSGTPPSFGIGTQPFSTIQ